MGWRSLNLAVTIDLLSIWLGGSRWRPSTNCSHCLNHDELRQYMTLLESFEYKNEIDFTKKNFFSKKNYSCLFTFWKRFFFHEINLRKNFFLISRKKYVKYILFLPVLILETGHVIVWNFPVHILFDGWVCPFLLCNRNIRKVCNRLDHLRKSNVENSTHFEERLHKAHWLKQISKAIHHHGDKENPNCQLVLYIIKELK